MALSENTFKDVLFMGQNGSYTAWRQQGAGFSCRSLLSRLALPPVVFRVEKSSAAISDDRRGMQLISFLPPRHCLTRYLSFSVRIPQEPSATLLLRFSYPLTSCWLGDVYKTPILANSRDTVMAASGFCFFPC